MYSDYEAARDENLLPVIPRELTHRLARPIQMAAHSKKALLKDKVQSV